MKKNIFKPHKWYLRIALAIAGVVASSTSALAVTFNFTYQPGITTQQIEAVELAGKIWSSYLKDTDVVVNIHVAMTNNVLPTGKLGGATPAITKMKYDKFKQYLETDGTANINLLPNSNQGNGFYSIKLQDGSIDNSLDKVLQTQANKKALSNDLDTASGLDGYIQLDAGVNWSYDYAQGSVQNNSFDFVSVILHEIGHVLGFVSGIDNVKNDNKLPLPTSLDMFRYSNESAAEGVIDFSVDKMRRYFSNDGGRTVFTVTETQEIMNQNGSTQTLTITHKALFARGEDTSLGGDGMQASHWANTNHYIGIMNPLADSSTIRKITKVDLTAMDYIGWNVNYLASLDMDALLEEAQNRASNAVIQDRMPEVKKIIEENSIYYWRWGAYW